MPLALRHSYAILVMALSGMLQLLHDDMRNSLDAKYIVSLSCESVVMMIEVKHSWTCGIALQNGASELA